MAQTDESPGAADDDNFNTLPIGFCIAAMTGGFTLAIGATDPHCASQQGGGAALLLGRFLPKLGGASCAAIFLRCSAAGVASR
jgi:hypothetical protein